MTNHQKPSFSVGQKVDYVGVPAIVLTHRKNGVTIGFWGFGRTEGKYIVLRVSTSYLRTTP